MLPSSNLRQGNLCPKREEIPKQFFALQNPFYRFVSLWFFEGADVKSFTAKSDISYNDATRHIKALLMDRSLEHNTKIAGAAWLASQWFDLKK